MQKSKSKGSVIPVKKKSSGSWILYFALVLLLLLVIAFFVYKGITGNTISTISKEGSDYLWEENKILNGSHPYYYFSFPSGVYLTGVRVNWTDSAGSSCKGMLQRKAGSGNDEDWVDISTL